MTQCSLRCKAKTAHAAGMQAAVLLAFWLTTDTAVLLEQALSCRTDCAPVWRRLADAQLDAGDPAAARRSIKRALALSPDEESPQHAVLLNTLALVEFAEQQYARAERTWRRSLGILEKSATADDPSMVAISAHLALLQTLQRRYGEAERLLLSAIAASGERPEVIDFRDRLARNYNLALRHRDAEEQARLGLALASRTVGEAHASLAPLWVSLGASLSLQRRHEEAEKAYLAALALVTRHYGPQHTFTRSVLEEFARMLHKAGRRREAKQMNEKARAILAGQIEVRRNTVDLHELQRR